MKDVIQGPLGPASQVPNLQKGTTTMYKYVVVRLGREVEQLEHYEACMELRSGKE